MYGSYYDEDPYVDAASWIKFGMVHHGATWNDRMYASQFDIPWKFWEGPNKSDAYDEINEWIAWKQDGDVFVIVNRKSYNELDRKLLHTLIESIHKYYKKGTC